VISHQYRLGRNLRLKTEAYYQHLFNVPVSTYDTSSFSVLNVENDYVTDPLINKGKGKNYGIEISLEKYLSNNFYYTLSNSLYQSKYTAADGKERNTRFNGNYIVSFLAGKDFLSVNKLRTIGINIKTIYAGGYRTTPIDRERSMQEGYTIFKEEDAYSLQNPAYFRTDLRLSIKWNRRKATSTLSLDIQNLTNRLNIYNQSFDEEKGSIITNYQAGLIPILNYKIEF
jgi:outer membrane receptor protein involved in Fe transport